MTSRERVLATLNHRQPDRIPIDLGSTIVTSITKNAYVDLKRYLGMPVGDIRMLDDVQQLPYLDEELLKRFDVDFRIVQLPPATPPDLRSSSLRSTTFNRLCPRQILWRRSTRHSGTASTGMPLPTEVIQCRSTIQGSGFSRRCWLAFSWAPLPSR